MTTGARPIAARRSGRVLVLGFDDRSFLTVIRSLGRYGLRVDAAWCRPRTIALRTRYLERELDLPGPEGPHAVEALDGAVRDGRYDLVVPCHDPDILPLQEARDRLSEPERYVLLGERAYRAGFDKIHMNAVAREVGVAIPGELVTADPDEAVAFGERVGWPVVVKPRASFTVERPSVKHQVTRAAAPTELFETVSAVATTGPVALQSFHPGVGVGVEFLARDGRVLYAFQHERVHEPLRGGGSSYRKSVPLDRGLLAQTEALVRALDYTGVGMAEFKLDHASGRSVFIELNARFWGSLPLAVASGADFPRFLYRMWVEGVTRFPAGYRVGVHGRHVTNDLGWLVQNATADHADPTLLTRPLGEVALEARHLLAGRERWDSLTSDDPVPFVAELAELAARNAARVERRVTDALRRSVPARTLRSRRLRRRMRTCRSIVFLCRGNICRSPFAEHRFRELAPRSIVVRSAGTYPVAGRPSPGDAVSAARDHGVDLGRHRSRVLDRALADAADVVIAFDARNLREALEPGLSLSGRAFLLSDVAPSSAPYVDDPWGGSLDDFRRSYRTIDDLVRRLATLASAEGRSATR